MTDVIYLTWNFLYHLHLNKQFNFTDKLLCLSFKCEMYEETFVERRLIYA